MNRFIVVDFETTGNLPDKDKIIQVGAVLIEDFQVKEAFSSFVFTDKKIPKMIQEITGITNEMIQEAPTLEEVMIKLLPLLEDSVFVAHHASFDLGFLTSALDELGYAPFSGLVIDTVQLAKILLPMAESYKLSHLTLELDILHENPHRADEDAKATADTFLFLIQKLREMPLVYLQRLVEITKYSHPDLSLLIEHVMSNKYSQYHDDEDKGYTFINQIALQSMEEEMEPDSQVLNQVSFESMFDQDGLLFHQFPGFELRPAQKVMAQEVMNAFENQVHLLAEAGTGTGKSLAYLIPALFWSKEHQEKIVIATHTINLQEQLFQRDIPLLKKILPFDFTATILKGRNNYLCLRKFEQQLQQNHRLDASPETVVHLAQMLTWVAQTKTGDIEEMNLSSSGRSLWELVKSDGDTCLNRKCPWFRSCFYHRAKQKAQAADLIITNHSLLLTNLKTEHRILPAYRYLIIDEAHQFEEVATKHLGYEINQYQFYFLLQRLYKDAKTGFLIKWINSLLQSENPDQVAVANKLNNHLIPLITKLEAGGQAYFEWISLFVENLAHQQDTGRKTLRITEKTQQKEEWKQIQEAADNMYIILNEIVNEMEDAAFQLRNIEADEDLLADINGFIKDMKEMMFHLSEWNASNDNNMVFWAEVAKNKKRSTAYLYAAPIEIGPYIKESLFDQVDSVVLTSATLSVNGSFDYASHQFGLSLTDEKVRNIKLESPFNYKEQAEVFIPKDVPDIREVTETEYIEHLSKSIAEIAIAFHGRTLILFTSHKMLQQTYYMLKEKLQAHHMKVLGHGIDSSSRSKLINRFTSETNTILLGTNSFWEGVDVPGESLSALIIVRLPFTPPNNPIHEAKTERLRAQRKNPFMSLSVPQAVIRFKQGFGRLIRTQRDRGIVVVFDRRVVESRYGNAFIRSLPPVPIKYVPYTHLIHDLDHWIK